MKKSHLFYEIYLINNNHAFLIPLKRRLILHSMLYRQIVYYFDYYL